MRILTKDGYIAAVGLLFELTDGLLDRISKEPQFYLDKDFLKSCYDAKGDNAHLFSLGTDDRLPYELSDIFKKFEQLVNEYKSVSWWNREENKFFIKRR